MRLLDEVDVSLLRMLQADGRITNAELAKRVGLSPPSVLQRVRALEKAGFVRAYAAILEPERLGFKITAITFINLSLHQDRPIENFRRAVQALPEVMECYHVSGEFDFVLKIVVRDMRAYETFIRESLAKLKYVGKIHTSFVFGAPKLTTELPI